MLEAGAAGERLDVSPSGLRRLAAIYEGVYGPLPRKGKGGRLFSGEALEALTAARRLVEAERFGTIREALEAFKRGERPDRWLETLEAPHAGSQALSEAVLGELRALRGEVEALRVEVATSRQLPGGESAREAPRSGGEKDGPLVRAARWLERMLRRGSA